MSSLYLTGKNADHLTEKVKRESIKIYLAAFCNCCEIFRQNNCFYLIERDRDYG